MQLVRKVSARTIERRLNRRLFKEGLELKKCRVNSADYDRLGRYYVVDYTKGRLEAVDIELDKWAEHEGTVGTHEVIAY